MALHFRADQGMAKVENLMRARVHAGEVIDYAVTPLYASADRAPKGVLIQATGDRGTWIHTVILNLP